MAILTVTQTWRRGADVLLGGRARRGRGAAAGRAAAAAAGAGLLLDIQTYGYENNVMAARRLSKARK